MKKSGASQGQSASELISKRIAELGDWRGETLSRMRKVIKEADPDVVEEWKWMGTPVWSHDGIICTGESYKNVVKLTFAKGASLKDPARLFNSSLDGKAARSTSTKEKKLTSPPSRRSFAKRSPSTVLASRNFRRKRSPEGTQVSDMKPIPDGVPVVMPMLVCRDASAEIDFCTTTFGAVELLRRPGPDGAVGHAALTIGGAMFMIEGEWPTLSSRAPQLDGASPVVIYVYVEDVDKVIGRAVAAGARVLLPAKNQFWGDRTGRILDPSGHVWTISTRIEETSSAERQERWSSILK